MSVGPIRALRIMLGQAARRKSRTFTGRATATISQQQKQQEVEKQQTGALQIRKPNSNDVVRHDELYYKPSNSLERNFTQTWVEYPEPVKKIPQKKCWEYDGCCD